MLFNSYEFILFFLPVTIIIFYILGHYGKNNMATLWLVVASFFFYGWWDIRYVPLLFSSITFNYLVGKKMEEINPNKNWLIFGISVNVLLLGYFKYTDFFLGTINRVGGANFFDLPHIILPLGISFFTFTQTAYLVDAYRGEAKNHSFITYCEFVTIFPHLIAGPIINHREMIPQFISPDNFKINYENFAKGLTIFSLGLFKKVAIADNLALWSNEAFNIANKLSLFEAWSGAFSYSLQLYFDFSGYSEMAIGLGLMLNLKFPINFNSPYKACSIIDFWRRWHMTLGMWVKNYLYIPMGGNRSGELKKMRNLLASMLLIGLWHGAGWTFVFWGGLHGIALVINHQWRRCKYSLPQSVNWFLTFTCVVFLWVFFRAGSLKTGTMFALSMVNIFNVDMTWGALRRFLELCFLVGVVRYMPNTLELMEMFKPSPKWKMLIAALLIYSILMMDGYSEFLYFQF